MTAGTIHSSPALGSDLPGIFPLGLGCMSMSAMYGHSDENESIATIHAALDRGINLLDTGDFYGVGHNEMLIGRALKDRREKAILSVKFGALRGPNGAWLGYDTRPQAVKNSLAHTLTRLKVDYIDIYRPARLDHNVPIEDTIGAIADLVQAGYVRAVGLSEVGPHTIRRAQAVHPICDLQIEYSLVSRTAEAKIFPILRDLGIGVTAFAVLSRGLLTRSSTSAAGDIRNHLPRFNGENLTRNMKLVEALETVAQDRGVSPAQLAFAWALAKGKNIVPLIGARTRTQLADSLGAIELGLSDEEVAHIEETIPASKVAGPRYPEQHMSDLDSER